MEKEKSEVKEEKVEVSNEAINKEHKLNSDIKKDLPSEEIIENSKQFYEKASEKATTFHTPELEPYVEFDVNAHSENYHVKSNLFKFWLIKFYFSIMHSIPPANLVKETLNRFEGEALLNSPVQDISIRYAKHRNAIYIDLGNDEWQQVKITGNSIDIIPEKKSPVRFVRAPGMLPLPIPVLGGSFKPLWDLLNIEHAGDRVLIISWLIGAMRPEGPFPILILQGEQGTSKSTTARILGDLIDPRTASLRSLPRSERDLAISATKSWVLIFDNLSGIKDWISDAFCRIATGGGFSTRTLFTDDIEKILSFKRPMILNGISDIATRHDLADRSIIAPMPTIPEDKRKSEKEIMANWVNIRPLIFGKLCEVLSTALCNIDDVKLDKSPRMADFAEWITAAEPSLPWDKGIFLKEYNENRDSLIDIALEADSVGTAVIDLMGKVGEWSGTPTDLLNALNKIVSKSIRQHISWPKRANSFSNKLRQVSPALRKKGIEIIRSKSGQRNITIKKIEEVGQKTVATPNQSQHRATIDDEPWFNIEELTTREPVPDNTPILTLEENDVQPEQGKIKTSFFSSENIMRAREQGEV